MRIEEIDINKIKVLENIRIKESEKEIAELMSSIKQHGLKQPIGVWKVKKPEGYVLAFGYRRLTACRKLGWKVIPASIESPMDKENMILINAIENIQRRDITTGEFGRICDLLERLGLTLDQIASRISKPVTRVRQALEIYHRIPADLREKVAYTGAGTPKKGMIPASVMYVILQVANREGLTRAEIKKLVIETIKQGLTRPDIEIIAKLMLEGSTLEEAIKEKVKYKVVSMNLPVNVEELEKLKRTHKSGGRKVLMKVMYGQIPPIKRPDFVEED